MVGRALDILIGILTALRSKLRSTTSPEDLEVGPTRQLQIGERAWFNYAKSNHEGLDGIIYSDKYLGLQIYYGKEWISTKVSPESADKLVKWLLKQYPQGDFPSDTGDKRTKKVAKLVSLSGGKANPGPGPRSPGGKLA